MAWMKRTGDLGNDSAWRRIRKRVLQRDQYLCQPCLKNSGRPTPANEVDHIVPRSKGGTHADENLQAICRRCHEQKTLADKGAKRRPRIGLDGFPVGDGDT